MREEWGTFWRFIVILFVLCTTSIGFAQQNSTGSKDLQYTVTVDLQELVETMKDLTTNVKTLSNSQKELTDNIKTLTDNMNNVNTKLAVIEERTTWIKGLLFIILAAIVGAIVTPIILYILSNRTKENVKISELNQLDDIEAESVDETKYKYQSEGVPS